jgi:DNA modification methylase
MLAEAETLDEIRQVLDGSAHLQLLIRQAQLGMRAANRASALRLRAEARAAEALAAMQQQGELARAGDNQWSFQPGTTTYAALGIARSERNRWGQVAEALPYLEAYAAACDARREELTRTGFLRYAEAQRPRETGIEGAPAVTIEPWVQPGDLLLLGPHRLLVADSTDPANLARLMGGETASLLVTDPPYLVDYSGGNHPQSCSNRSVTKDKTWDAYHDPATGLAFYAAFLAAALPHLEPDAAMYQWHAERRRALVEGAWAACGLLLHQIVIWRKSRAVLGRSHFMWAHEPCAYGWRQGHEPALRPPAGASTVWQVDGESDGIHPTQKPVELFRRPIEWQTAPGEIVLDPFAGSGTAIIAAELTSRRAHCLELSPEYAQGAVERWERLTGEKAVRG